jgi:molybdopterin-guanine dinucleotide biosynthesis protein A
MALAVVVLAGGEGRRLGGGKPLRMFEGETLIHRAVRLATAYAPLVAVSVREDAQVGALDIPLIHDDPEIGGPLAGVAAALAFARGHGLERVLTIPCDTPYLPADLAERLAGEDAPVVMAESGGRLHPTCAIWSVSMAAALAAYAASGRGSLRGLAEQIGMAVLSWPAEPTDPFFNINTMKDLAAGLSR